MPDRLKERDAVLVERAWQGAFCPFSCCANETRNAGVHAACHQQTQYAETRIESLWALYSDDPAAWEDGGFYIPKDCLTFSFKPVFFIRRKKHVGKEFGIQGKKSVGKGFGIQERQTLFSDKSSCLAISPSSFHPWLMTLWPSVSWGILFICVLGGGCVTLEHNGSDAFLIVHSPPGARRSVTYGLESGWGHTFSSWNNSFLHALTTTLINYYLKLNFSNAWVPPPLRSWIFALKSLFRPLGDPPYMASSIFKPTMAYHIILLFQISHLHFCK